MASKAFLLLGLLFVIFLVASEVSAREVAETQQTDNTNGLEDSKYRGGGCGRSCCGGGCGRYCCGGRCGRYCCGGGGGYYPPRGRCCRYGCCGGGGYGCRCCTSAEAYAAAQAKAKLKN